MNESAALMVATLEDCRRVLVVDDGVGAAKMLQLLISKLGGHEVQIAHDGPTALEKVEQFAPDLVLLDIGLPRMNGYEVAQKMQAGSLLGGATLVALTGFSHDDDLQKSKAAGFHEHIVKPIDLTTLRKLLACPKREPLPARVNVAE